MDFFKRIARWFKSSDDYAREYEEKFNAQDNQEKTIWYRLNELTPFEFRHNGELPNSSEADAMKDAVSSGNSSSTQDYYVNLYLKSRQYEDAKNNQRWAFFRTSGWSTEGKRRLGYAKFIQKLAREEYTKHRDKCFSQIYELEESLPSVNDLLARLSSLCTILTELKECRTPGKTSALYLDLSGKPSNLADQKNAWPGILLFARQVQNLNLFPTLKPFAENILKCTAELQEVFDQKMHLIFSQKSDVCEEIYEKASRLISALTDAKNSIDTQIKELKETIRTLPLPASAPKSQPEPIPQTKPNPQPQPQLTLSSFIKNVNKK